jgi:hypothetical protein
MERMAPALYGTGKAQGSSLDALAIQEFQRCCEDFHITAEGAWSFRADICQPDVLQLFDGELLDFLTTHFRALMDLRYFHGGSFSLDVPLSASTIFSASFCPEVISMCSALGISIDVRAQTS